MQARASYGLSVSSRETAVPVLLAQEISNVECRDWKGMCGSHALMKVECSTPEEKFAHEAPALGLGLAELHGVHLHRRLRVLRRRPGDVHGRRVHRPAHRGDLRGLPVCAVVVFMYAEVFYDVLNVSNIDTHRNLERNP